MKKDRFIFFVLCLFISFLGITQDMKLLGLDDVIQISEENSLDVFKAANLYQKSYFEYKNFMVEKLPTISLDFNPITYNKTVTQRYDAILDRDVYRSLETLRSSAGLNIQQNITATGGNIYINSNVNRFENLGDDPNLSYNNNIIRLGFNQALFGYNQLKWRKKTEPLKYEKAKKEFIEANESLHIRAVQFFFDLASAQLNKEISENNYENAVKLYDIGKERFKIATINQEELLNLELNLLNAEVAKRRADTDLMDSQFSLNVFLGNKEHKNITLNLPDLIPILKIDVDQALDMARENNSEMIGIKLKELNALSDLARIKSDRHFNPDLSGSIGLNKSADDYRNSFVEPLTQNRFSIKIGIPIVDWGTIKRKIKITESQNRITTAENEQANTTFKQKIIAQVTEFNLQDELVKNSHKAKSIAIKSNELILERFRYGNIDIVKLNASITAKDRASNNYLKSLKDYWTHYYTLQKMTLMDLKTNQKLSSKLSF